MKRGMKTSSCVPFFWLFVIFLSTISYVLNAQSTGVGINTTGAAPDNSAILDVSATDKGILIPRVSLTDVTSGSPITSPATGLMVYNTNASVTGGFGVGFYYWSGTSWVKVATGNPVQSGLTDGRIWVGDAANQPVERLMSGDATLSNTGVLDLANDAVETSEIQNGAVTNPKIADNAVNSIKIQDGTVSNVDLANMSANTIKGNNTGSTAAPTDIAIPANTVLGRKGGNIVAEQVATAQIEDAAVTDTKIANDAVTSAKILDGTIADADLSNSGVTAGTYTKVTVNAKGRVTSATTLSTSDIPAGSVTADNGLNVNTANNVRLGGALVTNTTISSLSASNKLNLTGTGVDAFNVDAGTLSVDFTNDRVGIGTTAPGARLDINGSTATNAGIAFRVNNSGGPALDNTFLIVENDGAVQIGTSPNGTLSTNNIGKSAITLGDQNVAHSNGGSEAGVNQAAIAIGRRSEVYHSGGSSASVAIGESNRVGTNSAYVNNSYAFGSLLRNTANKTMALGFGPNGGFTNAVANSVMITNNSTVPSFTVIAGDGSGTPGNVGVGLTAPLTPFHVHSPTTATGFEIARFTNGTTGSAAADGTAFGFANNGLNFYMDNKEGAGFQWWTSGTERMRLAGNGILTLNNNNTASYPPYNTNGGGAFSWNFTGAEGEVSIWNNVNTVTSRGFSFRQMTSASTQTELMRIEGDGDIFGKFRHVTFHGFNNASWSGNPANAVQWFPCPGGDGCDDNRLGGTTTPANDRAREWVAPFNGRILKVIIRVGNDSGSNPEFNGRIARSINGSHALLNPTAGGVDQNTSITFNCTQNNTFSRGDRIAIGLDMNCSGCYIEDTNYFVTVIWEFDIWD